MPLFHLKFLVAGLLWGPVVKTLPSSAGGDVSVPGQRAKIPHASGPKSKDIKQKQCCNKFHKDLKKIFKDIKKS